MHTAELVAGRELDALVAEKVMGWEKSGTVTYGDGLCLPMFRQPTHALGDEAPEFSTDIAAALPVFERLNDTDGEEMWQIRKDARGWIVGTFYGDRDSWGSEIRGLAATLPLAICRAALAVVEH